MYWLLGRKSKLSIKNTQTDLDLRNTTLGYGFRFQTPTVKEEIRRYSSQYNAHLSAHPNDLVLSLTEQPGNNRRLRIHLPDDLPTRVRVQLLYL
jgi:hypothetical protein